MKIEQKLFSRTTGWKITGDFSSEFFSAGIVLLNGDARLFADPAIFKSVRDSYPAAIILINTALNNAHNTAQHCDGMLSLSAIAFADSNITSAVVNVSIGNADRNAGKLLAEYCCHSGIKSILMLSCDDEIKGIESIENPGQSIPAFTIVNDNNQALLNSLESLHENVITGNIKSIGLYEEQVALNFGTTDCSGVFELDRCMARSKDKIVFKLSAPEGLYKNYMGEKSNDLTSQDTPFPLSVKLQHRAEDEERRRMIKELENKSRQLHLLTSELQAAKEGEAVAKAALDKKNKELEQFAYIASHDLQEPLRMITGFLTQLERKYSSNIDEKGQKYIHFAVDGAIRMRQVILDLLEFSRVGRIETSVEEIDLNELVKEAQALYQSQIIIKHARLNIGKLPVVNGQKILLRKAVQSLLDNALKYTRNDVQPLININALDAETHWQLAVADNGIGIDQQYFESIFAIFRRLHNRDEYTGTGMGLAITKKIAENLGGKIWVESELGKGSTFYMDIPKYMNN